MTRRTPTLTAALTGSEHARRTNLRLLSFWLLVTFWLWSTTLHGQEQAPQDNEQAAQQEEPVEEQDPASPTPMIEETMRTIREVENLNKYVQENLALKKENADLKNQIASLTKEVQKLTQQIATQTDTIRKQLLSLPELKIQSKVIAPNDARAVLDVGGKLIRIRENVEMSIPVENGVWTLINVQKISKDVVEINFSELGRMITIYD